MSSLDDNLPTVVEGEPVLNDPYSRQGAYAIRQKRSTMFTYAGGPIPDDIKKSYVSQQLPVRKQSLAAFKAKRQAKQNHHANIIQSFSHAHIHPSSPPSSPTYSRVSSTMSYTSEPPTPESACPQSPESTFLSPPSSIPASEEEEDFNFRNRPPSTVICTQPIVATDNPSPFSPQVIDCRVPFSQDRSLPWPMPAPSTSESLSTTDDGGDADTVGSEIQSLRKHSLGDIRPLESRSESWLSLSEGKSCSTISEDTVELSRSWTESQSSVLLRMQHKREEQRKSIYAYRQPQPSVIYPALLSRVGKELHKRVPTSMVTKNSIEYYHVFSGKIAVDWLMQVIRTNDRNLALLVGRALDAQNFFHDINYEHRLRDSSDELYRFRDQVQAMGVGQEPTEKKAVLDDDELPNGVFTLLTECYSPTCTRDNLCYSTSCPRKTRKTLKRTPSQSSLQETRNLWIHSVPQDVVDATPPEERKRQECIYELIYTEEDFVKDLRYVHNFWVKPLIKSDIIPEERREHFVQEVFWNMADIEKVNGALSQALVERQKKHHIVPSIGDIMLTHICQFDPFVAYGAHQVIGKFNFELEKKRNPRFAEFVEETERKPESRRLELNGYLTKPTTRLGRYNLLLREILKRTAKDNPDREAIPQVMEIITRFLVQVNTEAGLHENTFNLQQIQERLAFKSTADHVDLDLRAPERQLLMKGRMKRKGNSSSESSDLQVFLFDHYLVFAKIKHIDHLEHYRVYRKPIPLELLSISLAGNNGNNPKSKRASSILPYSRSNTMMSNASYQSSHATVTPKPSSSEGTNHSTKSGGFGISFYHHGRKVSPSITLYTSGASTRKTWVEKISEQQEVLAEKRRVFTVKPLVQKQFMLSNKVQHSVNLGEDILIGADQGVYSCNDFGMTRLLGLEKVSQIQAIEGQLLVLSDRTLWIFPLESLSEGAHEMAKRGRAISQNASFFYVGECLGKTFVCVVKTNTLSTTIIRVLEPVPPEEVKRSKGIFFKRLVRSATDSLKPYKDLYLPSEASAISLLKSKMCIVSPREIGVVDMKDFGVQTLLDPEDEELAFVFSRPDLRPMTIYRIQFAEYLVCYNEFGFFVDQRGRLLRSRCRIDWQGEPDTFALKYPYIIAFESDFIEVRHILTGRLEQLIRGTNIRCTHHDTDVIHGVMNDPDNEGFQLVFQLELTKTT
ncbi:RHO1 GDP-GTP exchange protein 2 [Apophysomyces ossiformis]|uniref:RHO1 GDP-GTP exchange protein 2 n=1 Tax=Apophysomyces ossiformis TaxID=679940 RepID=A0A8H7ETV5_9FUNG|nr:RHO1 GDP-GTP exchange protein 2 [Apophysomyces ossiformis]